MLDIWINAISSYQKSAGISQSFNVWRRLLNRALAIERWRNCIIKEAKRWEIANVLYKFHLYQVFQISDYYVLCITHCCHRTYNGEDVDCNQINEPYVFRFLLQSYNELCDDRCLKQWRASELHDNKEMIFFYK